MNAYSQRINLFNSSITLLHLTQLTHGQVTRADRPWRDRRREVPTTDHETPALLRDADFILLSHEHNIMLPIV